MKRVLIGVGIFLILVLGWLSLEIYLKYGKENISQLGFSPEVVSRSGEVSAVQRKGVLYVKTSRGRALVSAAGASFVLREQSEASFSPSGINLKKGFAEYVGKGKVKNSVFSCNFQGRGVITEKAVVVLEGHACGAEKGEEFLGNGVKKISLPSMKLKKNPDGVLVSVSYPSRIEVSSGPFFLKTTMSFDLASTRSIKPGNGVFYLRACVASGFICGLPRSVIFKNLRAQLKSIDKTPPQLDVSITPKGKVVIIRGSTEVGVKVFINGKRIPVETSGKFFHTLEFDTPGVKTVVVEAMDSAGNVSRKVKQVVVYGD